jgi:hypothetical protein
VGGKLALGPGSMPGTRYEVARCGPLAEENKGSGYGDSLKALLPWPVKDDDSPVVGVVMP